VPVPVPWIGRRLPVDLGDRRVGRRCGDELRRVRGQGVSLAQTARALCGPVERCPPGRRRYAAGRGAASRRAAAPNGTSPGATGVSQAPPALPQQQPAPRDEPRRHAGRPWLHRNDAVASPILSPLRGHGVSRLSNVVHPVQALRAFSRKRRHCGQPCCAPPVSRCSRRRTGLNGPHPFSARGAAIGFMHLGNKRGGSRRAARCPHECLTVSHAAIGWRIYRAFRQRPPVPHDLCNPTRAASLDRLGQ
jgi:hypothetical protein